MINIKLYTILLICVTVPLTAFAGSKDYGTATCQEITSIYDGDTFRCTIAGWPEIIGDKIGIRVAGIDTPELRDKRPHIKALALRAKQYVVQQLSLAQTVELRNIGRGKYFRIVADVYVDGENLGDLLISEGLAQPYDGGKKLEWK